MKNLLSGLIYNLRSTVHVFIAIPKRAKISIFVIFFLFTTAYWDTFTELFNFWIDAMTWRFVVPVLAGYMIWHNRYELLKGMGKSNIILSSSVLIISCMFLVIGQFSSTHFLRETSIILFFLSIALFIGGLQFTGKISFIIIYTILMTSLFDRFLESIEAYLKLITAFIGAHFVNVIGLNVLREGSFLRLPLTVLEVADSCSGVNQLITMFALGIPLAVITQKTFIKKILIIFISLVIALVMNWIRIILIIFWNYNSVKEHVHGPYEIYRTAFIFLIGFIFLLFINGWVESFHKSNVGKQRRDDIRHVFNYGIFSFRNILPLMVIMGITCCYLIFWSIRPVTLREGLRSFPRTISGWQGKDIDEFPVKFKHGFADEELIRKYVNSDGDEAFLYIGYFYQQTNEKEIVDARYAWVYDGARVVQSSPDHRFWIKDQEIEFRDVKVYSWFNISGNNIVNTKLAKIASLGDSLLRRRNNGSIVVLLKVNDDKLESTISTTYDKFLNENMIF